jgi:hypothetical protein
MRVLIGCEFSGVVRRAFRDRGHDAWSCDILPAADGSPFHIQGDLLGVLDRGWDLMIAHPPCTHLAVSGARWFPAKRADGSQAAAIQFFMSLAEAKIKRKAIENPICIMSTVWRKPDFIYHPWWFGHGEVKATCIWTENLPPLVATNIVAGREARVHRMPPSPDRWAKRSETLPGPAEAMADQWGILPVL